MEPRFATYAGFWPHYLRQHSRPATREAHLVGTGAAVLVGLATLASPAPWLLPLAFAIGYVPAWISHARIERNRPATFTHPLWSFLSDFKMLGLFLAGRLDTELARAGVAGDDPPMPRA